MYTKDFNRPSACLQVTVVSILIPILILPFFIFSGQNKESNVSNVSERTESKAVRLRNHNPVSFHFSNTSLSGHIESFPGIQLQHGSRKRRAARKARPHPTPKRRKSQKNKKRKKKKKVIVINVFAPWPKSSETKSKKGHNKNNKGRNSDGGWDPGTSEEVVGKGKSHKHRKHRKHQSHSSGDNGETLPDTNSDQEGEDGPNTRYKKHSKQNELQGDHRKHHRKSKGSANKHHRRPHEKSLDHISDRIFGRRPESMGNGPGEDGKQDSESDENHTWTRGGSSG